MAKPKRDEEREQRITMEIIVDAYDSQEQAMGWYSYLQDRLQFPFTATCIAKRSISPLRVKDEVDVIGMPSEDECEHEMFITIRWEEAGMKQLGRVIVPVKTYQRRGRADEASG